MSCYIRASSYTSVSCAESNTNLNEQNPLLEARAHFWLHALSQVFHGVLSLYRQALVGRKFRYEGPISDRSRLALGNQPDADLSLCRKVELYQPIAETQFIYPLFIVING